MKLKIFKANQIAMAISLLVVLLSNKKSFTYQAADTLLGLTLLVLFWFVVNVTSNFLEIEDEAKKLKDDETLD